MPERFSRRCLSFSRPLIDSTRLPVANGQISPPTKGDTVSCRGQFSDHPSAGNSKSLRFEAARGSFRLCPRESGNDATESRRSRCEERDNEMHRNSAADSDAGFSRHHDVPKTTREREEKKRGAPSGLPINTRARTA